MVYKTAPLLLILSIFMRYWNLQEPISRKKTRHVTRKKWHVERFLALQLQCLFHFIQDHARYWKKFHMKF